MQASDSGTLNNSGNEAINFRLSPNFKHMKKYLKSKYEEDMNSCSIAEQKAEENANNTPVQPPLPPNSPPPCSPPPDCPLGFTVKQELEEQDEYESAGRSEESTQDGFPEEGAPAGERPAMCKDFVRGTCTRGAACRYAHKLDLSQLDGVYRFCRDFENKRCVRPVCHFVHATTFEKEHFMRTGSLPPHATAHLRTFGGAPAGAAPAPPPPTPPQAQPPHPPHHVDSSGDLSPMFANAPAAALASSGSGGGGAAACAGAGALEARLPLDALPALPTVATVPAPAPALLPSLKRDWTQPFGSPPRDLDATEPLAKKCKRCDLTELRLQHSKAQVASMLQDSQELDEQLDKLVKSNGRLHAMLKMLLKPRRPLDNVNSNSFLGARLADDGNKELLLSQMKVLLAKILGLPAENGRDLAT